MKERDKRSFVFSRRPWGGVPPFRGGVEYRPSVVGWRPLKVTEVDKAPRNRHVATGLSLNNGKIHKFAHLMQMQKVRVTITKEKVYKAQYPIPQTVL